MISERPVDGGGNPDSHPPSPRVRISTVIVVYIAVPHNTNCAHYAEQFVSTCRKFTGGFRHRLIVCCNGGALSPKQRAIFDGLDCEFLERPYDDGWDISAYQDVAHYSFGSTACDLLVCFGESVRFHRSGWLDRLVGAATEHGEGIYGCLSSHTVRAHLNTTAFAVSPRFLNQYPAVTNKSERYEFEHGTTAMWRRIVAAGGQARLVTWDGSWGPGDWRKPDNILWRGTQENCLVFCNHNDRWSGLHKPHQQQLSQQADGVFK